MGAGQFTEEIEEVQARFVQMQKAERLVSELDSQLLKARANAVRADEAYRSAYNLLLGSITAREEAEQ